MKSKRSNVWPALVILLAAGVYSVVLFALKRGFTTANWLGYGFTMLAFLLLIVDTCVPSGISKRYPMLDLPMSRVSVIHCALQLIFGGIVAMLVPLSDTLVLVVCAALLVVYLIVVFTHFSVTSTFEAQDEAAVRGVSAIRLLTQDVESIAGLAQDDSLRQRVKALADDIRYSDPMSTPELKDLEDRIRSNVKILREEVEAGKSAQALQRAQNLQRFVEERNRKCLALKK